MSGCCYQERPCCHNPGYFTWPCLSSRNNNLGMKTYLCFSMFYFLHVLRFHFRLSHTFICHLSLLLYVFLALSLLYFVLLLFWKSNDLLIFHARNLRFFWEPPPLPKFFHRCRKQNVECIYAPWHMLGSCRRVQNLFPLCKRFNTILPGTKKKKKKKDWKQLNSHVPWQHCLQHLPAQL
jgi:hypothetical protein